MRQYSVQPEALEAFASVLVERRERIAAIEVALAQVHLPSGAFGRLPESDGLHAAYDAHARAERQACADLLEVLLHAAHGLRENAMEYRRAEHDTAIGLSGGDGST